MLSLSSGFIQKEHSPNTQRSENLKFYQSEIAANTWEIEYPPELDTEFR